MRRKGYQETKGYHPILPPSPAIPHQHIHLSTQEMIPRTFFSWRSRIILRMEKWQGLTKGVLLMREICSTANSVGYEKKQRPIIQDDLRVNVGLSLPIGG